MSSATVRRLLLGFVAGAFAGWMGGLLRTPAHAPLGSSAADAAELPQERFGATPGEPRATPDPGTAPATPAAPPGDPKTAEQHQGDSGHRRDDRPPPAVAVAPVSGRPARKPRAKRVKGTATASGVTTGDIAAHGGKAGSGAPDSDAAAPDAGAPDPAGGV